MKKIIKNYFKDNFKNNFKIKMYHNKMIKNLLILLLHPLYNKNNKKFKIKINKKN